MENNKNNTQNCSNGKNNKPTDVKQDNKNIAELLAIAPRSVLMLRHRFRQKIGMATDLSLEDFIEEILKY